MARVQSPRVPQTQPSPVKSRERDITGQKRLEASERQREAVRHRESRERSQPRGHERPPWHQETPEVQRPARPGPQVVQLQMIDRTVEEFGEDWDEVELVQYTQYKLQYTSTVQDHTSQYRCTVPASLSQLSAPPPAHEDPGFMPPPPPLPLPEFAQGCHQGANTEFSDPNEEKTFTVLLSKDISNGLLQAGEPLSPCREVLDLSLPKPEEKVLVKVNSDDKKLSHSDKIRIKEENCNGFLHPEDKISVEVKSETCKEELDLKEEFDNLDEDSTISIEPNRLPRMPNAIIAIQSQLEEYLNNLTEDEFEEVEKSGILESGPTGSKDSPVLNINDKTRMDCRYCGMIFSSCHVRKFHEESHKEHKEDSYDDGEDTRLFCGFCGKLFTSVKYRMLCEMTHTDEDIRLLDENSFSNYPFVCHLCGRQFKFESDLIAHNKLFCTEEQYSQPLDTKGATKEPQQTAQPPPPTPKVRPRLIDQEGWIDDDPSLPRGWRMKTRPRPSQEGQVFSVFLSPDNKVFHSRKAVVEYMKLMGVYQQADFDRVKEGAKPGPRKMKKRKSKFDEDDTSSKKRKSGHNGDFLQRNLSFEEDDESDDEDSGSESESDVGDLCTPWKEHHTLKKGWQMRAIEDTNGKLSLQYLSPGGKILESRKEMKSQIKVDKLELEKRNKARVYNLNVARRMPKKKKLVTNQVLVSKTVIKTRKLLKKDRHYSRMIDSQTFRYEPTVVVPKLKNILPDPEEYNSQDVNISADIGDIQDIRDIPNNLNDILKEMIDRQRDYESKFSSSEEEDKVEEEPANSRRTLRKRNARLVYEEPPLEDELDFNFFKDLKQPVKAASVERNSISDSGKAEESQDESIPESVESEEDIDDDYISDSWETELFALKRNPRDKMRFQEEDNEILNDWFQKSPYPERKEMADIGKILMVPIKTVRHWFQSKRVKLKELGKSINKKENKRRVDSDYEEDCEENDKYCRSCKQSFSSPIHLRIHLKRFHKKKLKKLISKPFVAPKPKNDNNDDWKRQEELRKAEELKRTDQLNSIAHYVENKRSSFSNLQLRALEKLFELKKEPSSDEIASLSRKANLSESSIIGWLSNEKLKQKIDQEARERVESSPSILKFSGRSYHVDREAWAAYRNNYCTRKSQNLSHYQKSYLKFYFMLKQFVDDDDVSEIANELLLASDIIKTFFEEARERKEIEEELATTVKGRNRGRPKKPTIDNSKICFDSEDEDLFEIDQEGNQKANVIFASKSRGAKTDIGLEEHWNSHQRDFMYKFYDKIEDPEESDVDFIVSHLLLPRQAVTDWFDLKKREKEYENKDSVLACKELLGNLIYEISVSKNFSFKPVAEFSCRFCGEEFMCEDEWKDHESIEAEEFEPENFQNIENVLDTTAEELSKQEIVPGSDDETESNNYASSHFEDSVDFSVNESKDRSYKSKSRIETLNFENAFEKNSNVKEYEIKSKSAYNYKDYFSYSSTDNSTSGLFYDEEPVTFEDFRNYFDSKDLNVQAKSADHSEDIYNFGKIRSFKKEAPIIKKKSFDTDLFEPRKVRTKIRFTELQRAVLLKSFHQSLKMNKYDQKSLHEDLAESLGLPFNNVKVWFQNAKSARKKGNPVYQ